MCLFPKLIDNPKYRKNKKNRGVIPPLPIGKDGKPDKRVLLVPVGCGKCMECRKQKAREWKVRLFEEIKSRKDGVFVTLTFSDESISEIREGLKDKSFDLLDPYDKNNYIAKRAVRLFLERWRKKYKKSLRHWFVTELGHKGTENIHLHGIVWTNKRTINQIWKYGYTWLSYDHSGWVNNQTINYTIKYVTKTDIKHEGYKPIVLCSPGIGRNYVDSSSSRFNVFRGVKTREFYKTSTGHKLSLPIYYRNHIYSDDEKELLWRNKLDKETRFVDGIEVDVSENDDKYYLLLEEARKKNYRLGFADNDINWSKRQYERQRAQANFTKRLQRAFAKDRNGGK